MYVCVCGTQSRTARTQTVELLVFQIKINKNYYFDMKNEKKRKKERKTFQYI